MVVFKMIKIKIPINQTIQGLKKTEVEPMTFESFTTVLNETFERKAI